MRITFNFYSHKCSACGACAIACMDQRDIASGQKPIRKIITYEKKEKQICLSISCLHCQDAPCVKSCPVQCLYCDSQSGLILYDNTNCVGCHNCEKVCPYDAITFNDKNKMEKCDGCHIRIAYGMEPACTKNCPTGALTCVNTNSLEKSNISEIYKDYKTQC